MFKLIIGCPILLTKVFPVSEFILISTFPVVHNREQHYCKTSYTFSNTCWIKSDNIFIVIIYL